MNPSISSKSEVLSRSLNYLEACCPSGSLEEALALFARVRARDSASYPFIGNAGGDARYPLMVLFEGAFVFKTLPAPCLAPCSLEHVKYPAKRKCYFCDNLRLAGPFPRIRPDGVLWVHDRCLPRFLEAVTRRRAETFWMGLLDCGSAVSTLPQEVVDLICAAV